MFVIQKYLLEALHRLVVNIVCVWCGPALILSTCEALIICNLCIVYFAAYASSVNMYITWILSSWYRAVDGPIHPWPRRGQEPKTLQRLRTYM